MRGHRATGCGIIGLRRRVLITGLLDWHADLLRAGLVLGNSLAYTRDLVASTARGTAGQLR